MLLQHGLCASLCAPEWQPMATLCAKRCTKPNAGNPDVTHTQECFLIRSWEKCFPHLKLLMRCPVEPQTANVIILGPDYRAHYFKKEKKKRLRLVREKEEKSNKPSCCPMLLWMTQTEIIGLPEETHRKGNLSHTSPCCYVWTFAGGMLKVYCFTS